MKKKLIAAIGLSLVVTANTSNFAYAAPTNDLRHKEKGAAQELKKFNIKFYNLLGEEALSINFNIATMKVNVNKESTSLGSGKNTYMKFFLYNTKTKKTEINKTILDDGLTGLVSQLQNKSFNYGDIIGIDFKENHDPKVAEKSEVSNDGKMHYYKITEEGIVPYSPDVVVNTPKVDANSKMFNITGEAEPNSSVTINVNGQSFEGKTSSDGKFNIAVKNIKNLTSNTEINVTMNSEIGKINENVKPNIINDIKDPVETKKQENQAKQQVLQVTNTGLQSSGIQIINGWGTPAGLISFNSKTMEFEVSQYNQYLGHNSNIFLNMRVYNPSTGKIVYSVAVPGDDNTSALHKLLDSKTFEYGDTIELSYDRSQGSVEVNNDGHNEMNITGTSQTFEITKNGLVESSIEKVKLNPLNILGGGQTTITKTALTGIVEPNQNVTVVVGDKIFSTTSNNKGEFKVNITDETGFTLKTIIEVYSKGRDLTQIYPTMENGIELQNSEIKIINGWGGVSAVIKPNPATMTFNLVNCSGGYLGEFSSDFLNLQVYDPSKGEIVYSKSFIGSAKATRLKDFLNNKPFNYGDVVTLSYDNGQGKVEVNNGQTNIMNTNGTSESFQITKSGIVKNILEGVQVKPFAILGGGSVNITKATLQGTTLPNQTVTAILNGESFTGKSNSKGKFNIAITNSKGFKPTDKIIVFSKGQGMTVVSPSFINGVDLQNSQIEVIDAWNNPSASIKFNLATMKLEAEKYYDSLYLSGSASFNISVLDTNTGTDLAELDADSSTTQAEFNNAFNGQPFAYGDVIRIVNNNASQNVIKILNGKSSSYLPSKVNYYKITKTGLEKYTTKLSINPFEVLNGEGLESGTLTGASLPNSQVVVNVDGKAFITTADANGKFSIKITNSTPFICTTKIKVWSKGCVPKTVYPIAPSLGISKSMLQLKDNSLGIAQTMTFNPTAMQIINSGSGFGAQLIDKTTGVMKASIGSGNFNVFTSNNDINGAKFNYGDILSIYETEETYLSDGKVNLTNGKTTTSVDDIKQFKSFKITPNGLVPVENKDLTNVAATYKGNSTVTVTGKTTPNTNVKLYYANDKVMTVKSNANGEINQTLPLKDAGIGSEIRLFLNNQNTQNVTVKYDSAMFNTNNSIQLINNESFPVIDMTFSPATHMVSSIVYPRDKTYAGVFYGNRMNISFINPTTGQVLKSVTSNKAGEIESFSEALNNTIYTKGEIIRIEYDNNLGAINILNDKKEIGNTTGAPEYFEITDKGLVNITNKFIDTKSLDILGNGKVTSATLEGTVKPNEKVLGSIEGNSFTTIANAQGNFSLNIKDENGFTGSSVITLSAEGFIPTHISPSINKSVQLTNSYINFYRNNFGWEATSLASSIGFDVNNNTFYVNNYEESFENGEGNYFTFYLYNSQGKELMTKEFNGGPTAPLATFLNGKSFNYGDIIGLKYNPKNHKPMIVNNNTVIGNITGEMEYFKITKNGLERVKFGNKAMTSNVSWNGDKLNITANIVSGNTNSVVNASKRLVLLNENNQILASENTNTKVVDGESVITGSFNSSDLSKVKQGQVYKIALQINGTIMPLYSNSNTPSTSTYVLSGNTNEQLSIELKEKQYINIKNSDEIGSYLSAITSNISNISTTSLADSASEQNKVYAAEFINRVGAKNIEALYNKSSENANFINWVLNNSTAMEEFLSAPNPDGHTPEGQPRATYSACLQVWSNIWNTYTNSHNGFNLKLAIATALTNGGVIYAFPSGRPVGSPVERYNIFESLNAKGAMMPNFQTLDVSHLMYVTNVPIANDQIIPMRNIILQNHNCLVQPGLLNNIAYTINYNVKNPHTGASVFGPNFYGKNPRIKTVWYDGGVCGATGRMGATGEQVFGIPAVQTPQPGHNAFIWYNSDNNSWNIGNAVDGWNATYDADMSGWTNAIAPNQSEIASYNLLYQKADTKNLPKSNMYLYLANTDKVYSNKLAAINEAIKIEPLNLGAWIALVNLYKGNPNTTIEQYDTLKNNIILTFKEYPMPMYNLLYQLKGVYTQKGRQNEFNNYVNSIKSVLESEVNVPNIGCIATAMLGQMKTDGLIAGNVVVQGGINIENVWNGQIANISLDGTNKTISVVPSGSYTNPYGWGEVFKILFEKANGDVIKSLVVNHQEPHPGAELEKIFNKLPYEYGDKIVVEYVNSSIITASNIITENGVVKKMNVKEPTTTFYITQNGLSLTKSGKANAVSIPVTMKDSNGKIIGNTVILNGQMDESVVYKNIEVPVGYKLTSVIFDGNTIYTGSNINNAQYAIAQEKYAKSESLDIIVSKINDIDTSVLQNEITEAKTKLNSGILYTQATTVKLQDALTNGEKVLGNSKSTQQEINIAAENIKNAVVGLQEWCNAREDLTNAISKGEETLANGSINGNAGYTKASEKTLENAIAIAKKLQGNTAASATEITNVISGIESSIKNLRPDTKNLENAINSGKGKVGTYTPDSKAVLNKAIENGEEALKNTKLTPSEIKSITDTINSAVAGLKNAPTLQEHNSLTNAINKANKRLIDGSLNGNAGYTAPTRNALTKVINDANSVLKNPNATESETTSAINSIVSAEKGLKVDTSKLQNSINVAKSEKGSYTVASKEVLNKELENAQKVLENTKSTPEEVGIAVKALNKAIEGLQTIKVTPNKPEVKPVIPDIKPVIPVSPDIKNISNGNISDNTGRARNISTNAGKIINPTNNGETESKTSNPKSSNTESITGRDALINGINNANKIVQNANKVIGDNNINSDITSSGDLSDQVNHMIQNMQDSKNNEHLNSAIEHSKKEVENAVVEAKKVVDNKNATPEEVSKATENLAKTTRQLSNGISKVENSNKAKVENKTHNIKATDNKEVAKANTDTDKILKEQSDKAMETGVGILVGVGTLGLIGLLVRKRKRNNEDK